MGEWTLKANKGGLSGPNYTVCRNGEALPIVVYDMTQGANFAAWEAFKKHIEASDYLPDREEWDDHARFEVGERTKQRRHHQFVSYMEVDGERCVFCGGRERAFLHLKRKAAKVGE